MPGEAGGSEGGSDWFGVEDGEAGPPEVAFVVPLAAEVGSLADVREPAAPSVEPPLQPADSEARVMAVQSAKLRAPKPRLGGWGRATVGMCPPWLPDGQAAVTANPA